MIILVLDHHELPDGIAPLLQRNTAGNHGIAMLESASLRAGIEYCSHHDTDLVLVDVAKQRAAGFKAIDAILAEHPHLRVAAIIEPGDAAMAADALRHGACACIAKTSTAEEFVTALLPILPLTRTPGRPPRSAKLPV